jgi:adenylyl-sulfate reductase (glutathione)
MAVCFLEQDAAGKECGLHSGNVVQSAAEQARTESLPDLWDGDEHVENLTREQLASLATGDRDKHTLVVLYAPWCQYSKVRKASRFMALCVPPLMQVF